MFTQNKLGCQNSIFFKSCPFFMEWPYNRCSARPVFIHQQHVDGYNIVATKVMECVLCVVCAHIMTAKDGIDG